MKKIIHLTDLHVGHADCARDSATVVDRIIYLKRPAVDYVVVVTGDVVNNANDGYEEARGILMRLRDAGFKVLVCPGNHDYGTGAHGNDEFIQKFASAFHEDGLAEYPRLEIIRDGEDPRESIAFIGLDTMAEEVNWSDALWAQGELGERQLADLGRMLHSDEVYGCGAVVVYMHHHPLHPKMLHCLRDSDELEVVISGAETVAALLFGHNHEGKVWHGSWGVERVYDGGASAAIRGAPSPHRVIDLSKDVAYDYDMNLL